jgi:hypothetical protein
MAILSDIFHSALNVIYFNHHFYWTGRVPVRNGGTIAVIKCISHNHVDIYPVVS